MMCLNYGADAVYLAGRRFGMRASTVSFSDDELVEAVRRAHKRLGTRTKHVAMAVPTGAVISKKIVVAARAKR